MWDLSTKQWLQVSVKPTPPGSGAGPSAAPSGATAGATGSSSGGSGSGGGGGGRKHEAASTLDARSMHSAHVVGSSLFVLGGNAMKQGTRASHYLPTMRCFPDVLLFNLSPLDALL